MSDVSTEIDDSHDPFAEFDAAAGVGTVRDPFPVWQELRGQCPVHAGNLDNRFGASPFGEMMTDAAVTPHHVLGFGIEDGLRVNDLDAWQFAILARHHHGYSPIAKKSR